MVVVVVTDVVHHHSRRLTDWGPAVEEEDEPLRPLICWQELTIREL